jgi:hypothetical protein
MHSARRLVLAVTLLAALVVVVVAVSCPRPAPRFKSEAELEDALLGNTAAEVLEVLGEPDHKSAAPPARPRASWRYDLAYRYPLFVDFDYDGTVRKVTVFKPISER